MFSYILFHQGVANNKQITYNYNNTIINICYKLVDALIVTADHLLEYAHYYSSIIQAINEFKKIE